MSQRHKLLRKYRIKHGIAPDLLAKRLGVARSTLRSLENGNRPLTAQQCRDLEVLTKGELTRSQLDPDIFGQPA